MMASRAPRSTGCWRCAGGSRTEFPPLVWMGRAGRAGRRASWGQTQLAPLVWRRAGVRHNLHHLCG
jgi:hypothetical protein